MNRLFALHGRTLPIADPPARAPKKSADKVEAAAGAAPDENNCASVSAIIQCE